MTYVVSIYDIGKLPEVPSLKEKVMFWKTYRHYIKQEIQRMRTASINSFKTLFIKGEKLILIFQYYYTALYLTQTLTC